MTWASFEDHYARLLPYLVKLRTGRKLEKSDQDAVDKPFKVKRPR